MFAVSHRNDHRFTDIAKSVGAHPKIDKTSDIDYSEFRTHTARSQVNYEEIVDSVQVGGLPGRDSKNAQNETHINIIKRW